MAHNNFLAKTGLVAHIKDMVTDNRITLIDNQLGPNEEFKYPMDLALCIHREFNEASDFSIDIQDVLDTINFLFY